MEENFDLVRTIRERLVHGVVHDLEDEVVEPSRAGRADVHAWPQADRFEALQNGDVFCGVGGFSH